MGRVQGGYGLHAGEHRDELVVSDSDQEMGSETEDFVSARSEESDA